MEVKLKTPLRKEDVESLKVGDVVYLSGTIYTARDRAHQRILEQGSPYPLEGTVIFHAGPLLQIKEDDSHDREQIKPKMVAVGPTTSTRMNPFQSEIVEKGVRAIIGKGGMDEETAQALVKHKAVYLAAVGGCAALYVKAVKAIENYYWLDLGVPEAIWELKVDNFGPLVVAMDVQGLNLYQTIKEQLK